jgi:hypothetical protein
MCLSRRREGRLAGVNPSEHLPHFCLFENGGAGGVVFFSRLDTETFLMVGQVLVHAKSVCRNLPIRRARVKPETATCPYGSTSLFPGRARETVRTPL